MNQTAQFNIDKFAQITFDKYETERLITETSSRLEAHNNNIKLKLDERNILVEHLTKLEESVKKTKELILQKDSELSNEIDVMISNKLELYMLTKKRTSKIQAMIECSTISPKYKIILEALKFVTEHFESLSEEPNNAKSTKEENTTISESPQGNYIQQNPLPVPTYPSITLFQFNTTEDYTIIPLECSFYKIMVENVYGGDQLAIENNYIKQLMTFQSLQSLQTIIINTKKKILVDRKQLVSQSPSMPNAKIICEEIDKSISKIEHEKVTIDPGRKAAIILNCQKQPNPNGGFSYRALLSAYMKLLIPSRTTELTNALDIINDSICEKISISNSLLGDSDDKKIALFVKTVSDIVKKYVELCVYSNNTISMFPTIPPYPLLTNNSKHALLQNPHDPTRVPATASMSCSTCNSFFSVDAQKIPAYTYCDCCVIDSCLECKLSEWVKNKATYELSACKNCGIYWSIYSLSSFIQ